MLHYQQVRYIQEYHSRYLSCHILQAGYTIRSFDGDWANLEWDQDDHFEELWGKGEGWVKQLDKNIKIQQWL